MATVEIENLPYQADPDYDSLPSIGLIVLATDYTIEDEFRFILEQFPAVRLYHSRIANADSITPESLADMADKITDCAALLPSENNLGVIAYGCTSATATIGEDQVFRLIRKAKPQAFITTPITAAVAAFNAFEAKRIGVLTPYISEVNQVIANCIRQQGFQVPILGSYNEKRDSIVSRISPQSIKDAVYRLTDKVDADAIFVSCTSIRMADFCEELEADTGLPVTSSNHAMAWHTLRLAGLETQPEGLGSLYSKKLAF